MAAADFHLVRVFRFFSYSSISPRTSRSNSIFLMASVDFCRPFELTSRFFSRFFNFSFRSPCQTPLRPCQHTSRQAPVMKMTVTFASPTTTFT